MRISGIFLNNTAPLRLPKLLKTKFQAAAKALVSWKWKMMAKRRQLSLTSTTAKFRAVRSSGTNRSLNNKAAAAAVVVTKREALAAAEAVAEVVTKKVAMIAAAVVAATTG